MARHHLLATAAFFCSLALLSGTAQAQQYSTQYNNCLARAKGTVQQSMCAQAEITDQDDRLNKAYQQLMRQYSQNPAKQTALRTDERAWIKKRDYDCQQNKNTTSGGCLLQQTTQRADYLESQLKP